MIKIFIGHYINVFYSTVDIALKKQPLLFLAKLMVYSAALTFFTANFHCNMTRKINSTPDFSTAENNQELANEVSCLKAMLTLMLQAMGQADAGRVMLKMEKQLALIEDETQAAVFSKTVKQIKQAYRQ